MMQFARMQDGLIAEIIDAVVLVDGRESSIEERYHPDFIAGLVVFDPANPPSPPEPVTPPVPAVVTRFQARAALYEAGHYEAVEEYMARSDTPMLMRLAWQDAQTFERGSAAVAALASALELSDDDLDMLFIAASGITA